MPGNTYRPDNPWASTASNRVVDAIEKLTLAIQVARGPGMPASVPSGVAPSMSTGFGGATLADYRPVQGPPPPPQEAPEFRSAEWRKAAFGGPLAAGAAGFKMGVDAFLKYETQIADARQSGVMSAPLFAPNGRVALEEEFAAQRARAANMDSIMQRSDAVRQAFGADPLPKINMRNERFVEQQYEKNVAPFVRAGRQTEQFFQTRAQAGNVIDQKDLQSIFDTFAAQEHRSQNLTRDVERLINKAAGREPNTKVEGQ